MIDHRSSPVEGACHIPVLLQPGEVCDALRICRRTLDRMRNDGRLPAIRIGKTFRYVADDIAALIEGRLLKSLCTPKCSEPDQAETPSIHQ